MHYANGETEASLTFAVVNANTAGGSYFKGIPFDTYLDICYSGKPVIDFLAAFLTLSEDECLEALLSVGVWLFLDSKVDREAAGVLLSSVIRLQRKFYASSTLEAHECHVLLIQDDGRVFEQMARAADSLHAHKGYPIGRSEEMRTFTLIGERRCFA